MVGDAGRDVGDTPGSLTTFWMHDCNGSLSHEITYKLDCHRVLVDAGMSRSLTLAVALARLGLLEGGSGKELCIHLIGCDRIGEGGNAYETSVVFRPLMRIFDFVFGEEGLARVTIVLNGVHLISERVTLSSPAHAKLTLVYAPGLYHSIPDLARMHPPDLIAAFNAGVWGYDDWIPTLTYISDELAEATPCLITSYNMLEGEDDEDRITAEGTKDPDRFPVEWMWTAEANPFKGNHSKPSHHQGEFLTDNHCWMCFRGNRGST